MSTALTLALAMLLDAALGEPDWLWSRLRHPAVLMGNAIAWLDRRLNHGKHRRAKGVFVTLLLILGGWVVGAALAWLGWVVEVVVCAILLAQNSLVAHVRAVGVALRQSLPEGRAAVAMIVSRDTSQMTEAQVARSAIESAAENLSDGVIAPAFWFLLGGLPGLLVYKAVNTADSMIGYRNDTYRDFGWAAARLDDLLNLIPARLTCLMILALSGQWRQWRAIVADAQRHISPNAGWPEAAMARSLGIALSGPRSYGGALRDFPYIYPEGDRTPDAPAIASCVAALWRAWAVMVAAVALLAVM